MMDLSKKQKMLALLDSLDDHLDSQDGEGMKGMSMEDEDDAEHSEPDGDEGAPAALVVEVGAPKDGPMKPPGGESGSGDAMSVIQAALASEDPKVKALAEAFMKSKGG